MTINTKHLRTNNGQLREVEKLVDRDELGDAAFRNAGEGAGDVMTPGAFDFGGSSLTLVDDVHSIERNRLFRTGSGTINKPPGSTSNIWWGLMVMRLSSARYILMGSPTELRYQTQTLSGWRDIGIWTTENATVDSNGFLVESSPVVRLFSDKIEDNGQVDSASFSRNGVGDYSITGTLGFAQEGWYVKIPQDANGNIKVFVEYEYVDGDINVRTFEPLYDQGKATKGDPVDMPDGRWIDIRLHEEPVEE